MTDAFLYPGTDLTLSASGDLLVADGVDEATQRVLRRLLTVAGDYLWHPTYGAGLPARIGQPLDASALTALITSQMYLERGVSQNPAPVLAFQAIPNGLATQIQYTHADTGQPAYLSFTVTP